MRDRDPQLKGVLRASISVSVAFSLGFYLAFFNKRLRSWGPVWVPSTHVKAGVVGHICKPSAEDAETAGSSGPV